jgi:hypothetical protein
MFQSEEAFLRKSTPLERVSASSIGFDPVSTRFGPIFSEFCFKNVNKIAVKGIDNKKVSTIFTFVEL